MKKRVSKSVSSRAPSMAFIAIASVAVNGGVVHADLVYESGEGDSIESVDPGASRRESERGALEVAEAARDTRSSARKASRPSVSTSQVYAAVESDAAVSLTPPVESPVEVEHLSRSELLRRERMRQEMRNEDILQERLEELRLRDEKRREDELLGSKKLAAQEPAEALVASPAPAMEEVVVSTPSPAPELNAPAPASSVTSNPTPVLVGESLTGGPSLSEASSEQIAITVSPRGGIGSMSSVTGYTVQPRFSAGVDLGVAASDHVSFSVGYLFSEYGVLLNSSNPWVYNLQWYTGTQEAIAMKQNVVDATLKLHVLGPEARIRPFLGGGAAWSKSFINYDQRIIDGLYQSGLRDLARDYEAYSILGSVSTGLDIRITKSISVGAQFKYYAVLTSRENQSLNNAALLGNYGYPVGYWDSDKQILGGSLARSAFYTITGGLNFSF
jgi:hypothetical protein